MLDSMNKRLFRCDTCGELFWEDSPQEIQRRHLGHYYRLAVNGTWWEWLKLRLGLIR